MVSNHCQTEILSHDTKDCNASTILHHKSRRCGVVTQDGLQLLGRANVAQVHLAKLYVRGNRACCSASCFCPWLRPAGLHLDCCQLCCQPCAQPCCQAPVELKAPEPPCQPAPVWPARQPAQPCQPACSSGWLLASGGSEDWRFWASGSILKTSRQSRSSWIKLLICATTTLQVPTMKSRGLAPTRLTPSPHCFWSTPELLLSIFCLEHEQVRAYRAQGCISQPSR